MTRAFHLLVALLVAVPLGAGGLCCCLLGSADGAPGAMAAEAPGGCCSGDPAPLPADGACPVEPDEEDCSCPVRETALVSGAGTQAAHLSVASLEAIAPPFEGDEVLPDGPDPTGVHVPHPPPKTALYRTLSVFLC